MATVVSDLKNGSSVKETVDGCEAVRIFQVDGVTGNADAKIIEAIVADGIPPLRSPHPCIPGIYLMERSGIPNGISQCIVTCTYRNPKKDDKGSEPDGGIGTLTLSIDAGVQEIETNKDKDGNGLSVTFISEDGTVKMQPAKVRLKVPILVYTLRLRVLDTSNFQDWSKYVGKIDKKTGTFLCTGFKANPATSNTYDCEWTFSKSERGWKVYLAYVDESGQPPVGFNDPDGNGIGEAEVYPEEDFSFFNLENI